MDSLKSLLGTTGVEVIGVRTAADCLQQLHEATFDCMVLDLSFARCDWLFAAGDTQSRKTAIRFPL